VINRELQIELYAYNAGIRNAQRAYYNEHPVRSDCLAGICTDERTCFSCRSRAKADLLVATSEAECAELLAIIDRPFLAAATCGTTGGYQAHRRRGEPTCQPCRDAHRDYRKERMT